MRWYVARALGERGTDPRRTRVRRSRRLIAAAACAARNSGNRGLRGDEERQDENEPAGEFPVEVNSAKFPARQRLAETSDLVLEWRTPATRRSPTSRSRSTQATRRPTARSTSAPTSRTWPTRTAPSGSSKTDYPKLLAEGVDVAELDAEPTAGAETAATDTYAFGPLPPGESLTAVWRVTPVVGGTFTVHYEVAGGLDGQAKAVTADGSPVEGEFVATISTKPPKTRVTDSGEVEVVN